MRVARAPILVAALVATSAWLLVPRIAMAQAETPSPDPMTANECVGCHAIPDIVVADDGQYRPDIYVRPEDLAGSLHAGFSRLHRPGARAPRAMVPPGCGTRARGTSRTARASSAPAATSR